MFINDSWTLWRGLIQRFWGTVQILSSWRNIVASLTGSIVIVAKLEKLLQCDILSLPSRLHGKPCTIPSNAKNLEYWHLISRAFQSYTKIKWKCKGLQLSQCVSWHYYMVCDGIPYNVIISHGRCNVKIAMASHKFPVFPQTFITRNSMEGHGNTWNAMAIHGIPWPTIGGVYDWNILEGHDLINLHRGQRASVAYWRFRQSLYF